jgi:hypothetical protein
VDQVSGAAPLTRRRAWRRGRRCAFWGICRRKSSPTVRPSNWTGYDSADRGLIGASWWTSAGRLIDRGVKDRRRKGKGEPMHPPSSLLRGAISLLTTLLAVGAARAQDARPTDPAPRVHQLIIRNGPVQTVTYFVQGGSPHQQGLYRALQFTENELALFEEFQQQRMGYLVSRAAPTWRPSGARPIPIYPTDGWGGWDAGTYSVQQVNSALELIRTIEAFQTELALAQKKLIGPPDGRPR